MKNTVMYRGKRYMIYLDTWIKLARSERAELNFCKSWIKNIVIRWYWQNPQSLSCQPNIINLISPPIISFNKLSSRIYKRSLWTLVPAVWSTSVLSSVTDNEASSFIRRKHASFLADTNPRLGLSRSHEFKRHVRSFPDCSMNVQSIALDGGYGWRYSSIALYDTPISRRREDYR